MACPVTQLQNIRFKDITVMMLSIDPNRVLVQWKLEPTTQNLKNLKFYVDRGESPSDYEQIAGPLSPYGLYEYVDTTANLLDLNKVYYYRVRAAEEVNGVTKQTFTSGETTWDGNLDPVGLYVVEEHYFYLRWVVGVPVLIYKKIHDGAYCTNCWDNILKKVTLANCQVCYGTGRVDGYYPPMEAWMSLEPDPKMEQVVDWGIRQSSQTDILFINYPLLTPDDLVIELKPNRIFKVENVRYPEKNRTTLLQMCRLNAVNQSDIEYKIQVPEDVRRRLVAELEEREKEREF